MRDNKLPNSRDKINKVGVIIPIYKFEPTELEKKSLQQCLKILGKYPIIFFCGHTFESLNYEDIVSSYGLKFEKPTFDEKYFKSLNGYNELCLSDKFYNSFSDFEYILIYQLDAWVFRDELMFWCEKGYDYIGAPWYDDWGDTDGEKAKLSGVGNGGFSLRKVNTFVHLLRHSYRPIRSYKELIEEYPNHLTFFRRLYYVLKAMGYKNNVKYLCKKTIEKDGSIRMRNEDVIFAFCGLYNVIKIPKEDIALAFSIELHPKKSFYLNGEKLPFGCHAWDKRDVKFWMQYIK